MNAVSIPNHTYLNRPLVNATSLGNPLSPVAPPKPQPATSLGNPLSLMPTLPTQEAINSNQIKF